MMFMEEEYLFEGSCLGHGLPLWGDSLTLFDGKVDIPSNNTDSAPCDVGELYSNNCKFDLQQDDWMSSRVDLDILELIVANDCNPSFLLQSKGHEAMPAPLIDSCSIVQQPSSPASSEDSGVASPGSDDLSSIFSGNSPVVDSTTQANNELEVISEAESSPTSFFRFPVELCDELPVLDSLDDELLKCGSQSSASQSQLLVDANDILIANATTASTASSVKPTLFEITKLPVLNDDVVQMPSNGISKARCGRKSKVTNVEEKKQRKRAQNKNAATRYRERKRQEAMEKEVEFSALDNKNKMLKDKVSQISREINYLKELMIEVYTIKGVIS